MNFYLYVAIMAVVTYLIRMIPLVVVQREIKNRFIKSFLYYVPYAALASMTFPAIVFSTTEIAAALAGFAAALVMAFRGKGLLPVALGACIVVFIVERGMEIFL